MNTSGRYHRRVEETIYFCCIEIVADAIDSGATHANIRILDASDTIRFEIAHDGPTRELSAVIDRVEALGGQVDLQATADGASASGRLPISVSVGAPA
jgi:signal transduction histidine kinase